MTPIAIIGANGRMGQRLGALAREHECEVVSRIGRGMGEGELRATPQVLVDFSTPQATRQWLEVARGRRIAMLIGTTGLTPTDLAAIDAAAQEIPVLQSPNMSLGVAALFQLARRASELLGRCDIEIIESHHRGKKDAPSGTALGLVNAIVPHGTDAKIPIHSLRLGDEIGRHTVYFALPGERVELTHLATSRDTFARGALRAATWLARQKPGRYSINDLMTIA